MHLLHPHVVGAILVLASIVIPALLITSGNYPLGFERACVDGDRPPFLAILVLVALMLALCVLLAVALGSRRRRTYARAMHHNPRAYGFESYRGPDGRFRSVYKSYSDDHFTWTPLSAGERAWLWLSCLGAYIGAMAQWAHLSHTAQFARSTHRLRPDEFWPSILAAGILVFGALWLLGVAATQAERRNG